jgi:hypothetical protein
MADSEWLLIVLFYMTLYDNFTEGSQDVLDYRNAICMLQILPDSEQYSLNEKWGLRLSEIVHTTKIDHLYIKSNLRSLHRSPKAELRYNTIIEITELKALEPSS